jgi:glycosyltransferase involved in cell wall biosynthesis
VPRGILLIGNFPPPFGGIPTHLAYLAPFLSARGWDVHVLSTKYRPTSPERVDGFTVHSPRPSTRMARLKLMAGQARRLRHHFGFALHTPWEYYRCVDLYRIAREIIVSQNILVISAYHLLPAGLVGVWASRAFSIPLVTTIFGELYAQPEVYHKRHREVEAIFETSRRILSCSGHCARSAAQFGLSREVGVVYYGIDTMRFHPRRDGGTIRSGLRLAPTDRVVLFVGRLTHEMGVSVLLQSIPEVLRIRPDTRFILAGRAGELLPLALESRDRHAGRVAVMSDIPDEQMPNLYSVATIVVVPSLNSRACLGLAIAEGMAAGKPVVVSAVGGGPEVATDGETGLLVPPGDSTALARALLRLIDDDDAIARMGAQGRAAAEERFDKDLTNRAMERHFEEVAR